MKSNIFYLYLTFLMFFFISDINAQKQENSQYNDKVVHLKEVTVYPNSKYANQKIKILKPNGEKKSIHVSGKGKTSIVSCVFLKSNETITIEALEFYFNYKWEESSPDGFIIRPLLLTEKNKFPGISLISDTVYYIGNDIKNKIFINLSGSNIKISGPKLFFIGLEFITADGKGEFENFNITMVEINKRNGYSYIKGSCLNCDYTPFDLEKKTGVSLKYKLYYSN